MALAEVLDTLIEKDPLDMQIWKIQEIEEIVHMWRKEKRNLFSSNQRKGRMYEYKWPVLISIY